MIIQQGFFIGLIKLHLPGNGSNGKAERRWCGIAVAEWGVVFKGYCFYSWFRANGTATVKHSFSLFYFCLVKSKQNRFPGPRQFSHAKTASTNFKITACFAKPRTAFTPRSHRPPPLAYCKQRFSAPKTME